MKVGTKAPGSGNISLASLPPQIAPAQIYSLFSVGKKERVDQSSTL